MKLSNGQIIVVVGGLGLVGWYLSRRPTGQPFSMGGFFDTILSTSPGQAELAQHFANQSGGSPSRAGVDGRGVTSVQPVYAGALAGLGSFVTALFRRASGPGNNAPAGSVRASASSGGGVSQPTPGLTERFTPDVFFGWGSEFLETDDWYQSTLIVPPGGSYGFLASADTSYDPFAGLER